MFSLKNVYKLIRKVNLSCTCVEADLVLRKRYFYAPSVSIQSLHTETKNKPNMILDSPEFASLFTQALCHLVTLFRENNYELRIAGGAVRDLLLGIKPKDVDFATTATPDEMKRLFEKESIKLINNRGEKHGTITARIHPENFEITTLRIDVVTDGRHAEVEFTTDWKLDASRRDLTINSMFLGEDGTLYDFFNGYEDLMNRKIVFVGDPEVRILEDYLRILRYFRFYGRIAKKADDHDPKTLAIIEKNRHGLVQISGERIWLELSKIVVGNFNGDLIRTMIDCKLHPMLGLPNFPPMDELNRVINITTGIECNPITILVSLLKTEEEMMAFHTRCKLSCFERDLGLFIIKNRHDRFGSLLQYQKVVVYTRTKNTSAIEWAKELMKYNGETEFIPGLANWTVPKLPINGTILVSRGVPVGKKMGHIMERLTLFWVDSEFKKTTEQLLEHLPEIEADLEKNRTNKSPPPKRKK